MSMHSVRVASISTGWSIIPGLFSTLLAYSKSRTMYRPCSSLSLPMLASGVTPYAAYTLPVHGFLEGWGYAGAGAGAGGARTAGAVAAEVDGHHASWAANCYPSITTCYSSTRLLTLMYRVYAKSTFYLAGNQRSY